MVNIFKLFLILFLLLLESCTTLKSTTQSSLSSEGEQYKAALLNSIKKSTKIVITEHTHPLDAYDESKKSGPLKSEITYKSVTLDKEQTDYFIEAVAKMPAETQDAFAACLFYDHHRIYFINSNGTQTKMNICFHCSQIEWDAISISPPWAIYETLSNVITHLGMTPEDNWQAKLNSFLGSN